jgi:cold shock CspA family protein
MHTGAIVNQRIDKGFGFIAEPNQPDLFFHANDLCDDLPFDERLQERRVKFDVVTTAKGPRAKNIQPAE